ncbi:DUF1007 family protein [Pseudooceanicola nitratireducens]|uniref:DUF1007 family protein n=1 Tax=Pseudooceanicola nitratireducens TaxID=517719 RepID=UPI0023F11A70|nr:DUF1007 family protein [Pseudooceanicola nitratireducens]
MIRSRRFTPVLRRRTGFAFGLWPGFRPGAGMMAGLVALSLAAGLWPGEARAHPHVFVDTALTVELDAQQRITAVTVTWVYDDFYSLLVLQDMGLDEDADGSLTPGELAQLDGWDMKWIEGYAGDLYVADATGRDVTLSPPQPLRTDVMEGRIVTQHRRVLPDPLSVSGASLHAYDPEFYTAYDLTGGVTLMGVVAGCSAGVARPDEDSAYAEAQALMAQFPEDAEEVPLMGHVFAETVTITCAPKS